MSADEWKRWRERESRSDLRKRRLAEAVTKLSSFGRLIFAPQRRAERRRELLRRGLRTHLRKVAAARRLRVAGGRVVDMLRAARDERAARGARVSGATRVVTVVDTVRSKLAASRARHKAAVPARGRRGGVALVTAAALGPVSADAIAAYVDLGYG